MEKLYEKTLNSKAIFEGKMIQVQLDDVLLPNGKTSTREIVKHPGAVAIIALTQDKKLLLVKQFRKPLEKVIYEIPAGKVEQGEEPLHTAKRELKEETGYSCESLNHVVSFYTSPGFADELLHIYFTDSLIQGNVQLDEDEFLVNVEVSLDEAIQMINKQDIFDAKTVYAVQYLQLLEKLS